MQTIEHLTALQASRGYIGPRIEFGPTSADATANSEPTLIYRQPIAPIAAPTLAPQQATGEADLQQATELIGESTHMTENHLRAQAPVDISLEVYQRPTLAGSLGRAAAEWITPPTQINIAATTRLWRTFANEPGAPEFARFLNRLRQTVNSNDTTFRRNVAQWLTQLESNPSLRESTFTASIGGTESCEDRVSLTYNTMRKLSMAAEVSRGQYDQRLPELVNLARGMFRLEQLEIIARETTATLVQTYGPNRVDEIEVYLGDQVMLREPLALPVETANMAYFRTSGLTQDHMNQAQARVEQTERMEFANYLSTNFAPWQEVIQRQAPELYEQAQEQLIDAMSNEFTRRMNNQLQRMALLNQTDAERAIGAQVRAEIEQEVYGQLTRDFLASKHMLNLLR